MTVKIGKKDRLNALMTIWKTLRDLNAARPLTSQDPNFKLLKAVEDQLKDVLDLKVPEKTVEEKAGEEIVAHYVTEYGAIPISAAVMKTLSIEILKDLKYRDISRYTPQ